MCYINGVKVSLDEYKRYKQHQKELVQFNQAFLYKPVFRGFDYGDWPMVKPIAETGEPAIVAAQWGYLPSSLKTTEDVQRFRYGWRDEGGIFHEPFTTLNAMSEELLRPGKMFRESALQRRCLILSSGFYEFRHLPSYGKKGQLLKATVKIPYHITIPGKPVFAMAGIYNPFTDPESGEQFDTCAMITTSSTGHRLMSQVHNSKLRMPVVLTDELADEWLQTDLSEARIQQIAAFQYPSRKMKAYTVKKNFLEAAEPEKQIHYPGVPALINEPDGTEL